MPLVSLGVLLSQKLWPDKHHEVLEEEHFYNVDETNGYILQYGMEVLFEGFGLVRNFSLEYFAMFVRP